MAKARIAGVLLVGAGVLAAALPAQAAKTGGDAHFNALSYIQFTDPALAYLQSAWQIEQATCVKLVNYPDKSGTEGLALVPEAADSLPVVSKDGKTYTFTVTPGKFRFYPGNEPVTAKTFQAVFNRDADPKMNMAAPGYLTEVVGAQAVLDGKAKSVSGVQVKGNRLIFHLVAPTGDFLSRLSLPFFCALPVGTPHDPNGVIKPAMAGPYYYKTVEPNRRIVLAKNPSYHGSRPTNFNTFTITYGQAQQASLLQIEKGQVDWAVDGVPGSANAELWDKYGPTSSAGKSGKQQFFVNPQIGSFYVSLNTSRPLFGDQKMRQAVNFAIDRQQLSRQNGAYASRPMQQTLPPGMIGYQPQTYYGTTANLGRAKQVSGGKSGSAVLYASTSVITTQKAQVLQAELKQLGVDVQIQQYARATQLTKEGTKGEPFDMGMEGWIADYPDPYAFLNVNLDGTQIHDANNQNYSYLNDPGINDALHQAAKLRGTARGKAYMALDRKLTQQTAMWAPYATINDVEFWAPRIGCQMYAPAIGLSNLNKLCLR